MRLISSLAGALLLLAASGLASTAHAAPPKVCNAQLWTMAPDKTAPAVGATSPVPRSTPVPTIGRSAGRPDQEWCFEPLKGGTARWKGEPRNYDLYRITNKRTGLCLRVANSSKGAPVHLGSCGGNNTPSALWLGFPGDLSGNGGRPAFDLVNAEAHRCLDIPGGKTAAGTRLIIWDCNSRWNQHWYSQGLIP